MLRVFTLPMSWKSEAQRTSSRGTAWRVGFSGNLLWERKASTNPALIGVPDIKFGAEAGAFAEFYPASWLRARVDLRRGIVAHDGLVAEMKLDAFARINDTWKLGIGPRMVVASADYVRTYFGSIPGTVGTGGLLQRFNTGIVSYGAIAQATYNWTERFQTTVYAEYKHLVGDAAKAPIRSRWASRRATPSTSGSEASRRIELPHRRPGQAAQPRRSGTHAGTLQEWTPGLRFAAPAMTA